MPLLKNTRSVQNPTKWSPPATRAHLLLRRYKHKGHALFRVAFMLASLSDY